MEVRHHHCITVSPSNGWRSIITPVPKSSGSEQPTRRWMARQNWNAVEIIVFTRGHENSGAACFSNDRNIYMYISLEMKYLLQKYLISPKQVMQTSQLFTMETLSEAIKTGSGYQKRKHFDCINKGFQRSAFPYFWGGSCLEDVAGLPQWCTGVCAVVYLEKELTGLQDHWTYN